MREQIWCDLKEKYPVNVEESFNYATLIQHIRYFISGFGLITIFWELIEMLILNFK